MEYLSARRRDILFLAIFLLSTALACGSGGQGNNDSSDAGSPDMGDANATPSAVAEAGEGPFGVDRSVSLDASGSTDPDGDELEFDWTLETTPSSSTATLQSPSAAQTRFTPDVAGSYELSVTVSDGAASDTDTLTVVALGEPQVDAGEDIDATVGDTVTVDASTSNDTGTLSYSWSFVTKPSGSSVRFDGGSNKTARFTPDVEGVYVAQVEVSNAVATATDRVTIQVEPQNGGSSGRIFVDADGSDSNPGTDAEPVATLDAALAISHNNSDRDRIVLTGGTYDLEDTTHTISSEIDITGPLEETASAELQGNGTLFELDAGAFLTVDDLAVTSGGIAFSVGDDANLSVIDITCEAKSCINAGEVLIEDGGGVEVVGSTLVGTTGSTAAITTSMADELTVQDTTIRDFNGAAISVLEGPLTVRDSTLEQNGQGVSVLDSQSNQPTLIRNTNFSGNVTSLEVESAENVTLTGSSIDQSTSNSIAANGGALIVRDSTIRDGSTGIVAESDVVLTIRNTDITGHRFSGVRIDGAGARVDLGTESEDAGNSIFNNTRAQVEDARPANAQGRVTLAGTGLGVGMVVQEPPSGTYSGPGFDDYGILIQNSTEVIVY